MIIKAFTLMKLYKINLIMGIVGVTGLTICRILYLQVIVNWWKVEGHTQVRAAGKNPALLSGHYAEISHTVQSPNTITDGKWRLH